MTDMEIEIYEAEHQPFWLLDLGNSDIASAESEEGGNT